MIKETKRGYKIVHCHGKDKGKTIKEFKAGPGTTKKEAYKKAVKMHKAIQSNKK